MVEAYAVIISIKYQHPSRKYLLFSNKLTGALDQQDKYSVTIVQNTEKVLGIFDMELLYPILYLET